MSVELAIVLLNAVVLLLAYFWVYPAVKAFDLNKIAWLDLISSGFVLLVVGVKFYGSGQAFNFFGLALNWFWFSLLCYSLLELPLALWYFRKHHISFKP